MKKLCVSSVIERFSRLAARAFYLMLGGLAVLLSVGLAALPATAGDHAAFDPLEQTTVEPANPNIMLVLDNSGSMSWSSDRTSADYPLRYTDPDGVVHSAVPQVAYDYTSHRDYGIFYEGSSAFPNKGAGHGYWLKWDRAVDPYRLKIIGVGVPLPTTTQSFKSDRIVMPYGHGYQTFDLVYIWDVVGHPEEEGLYEVSYASSTYICVNKVDGDLDAHWWHHLFPVNETALMIQRVRIGPQDLFDLEPRDDAEPGLFDATYGDYLYVQGTPGWYRGDIIMVTGLPSTEENGVYMIRTALAASSANPGYSYFRVTATDANGTWDWDDPAYTFTSAVDAPITIQRVMPASRPLPGGPVWFYIPPSRMAITKNVLGSHAQIYEPSPNLVPAGWDEQGVPYYTFAPGDPAPDSSSGAYYSWYYRSWRGWSESDPESEPVPDAVVTPARPPADLIRQTSDRVNWGLVTSSGSCVTQDLLVEVNPDDSDQLDSVLAIDGYLDVGTAGGLIPSGSSPVRAALQRAREGLLTGWDDGTYHPSTWDLDTCRDCGRIYGLILLSDGLSNSCNPNNSTWTNCPNDWPDYPAGVTDDLWQGLDDSGTFLTEVRTWVIGISELIGFCELNFTAYRGRTDASSPSNDCGLDTLNDPRLPEGSPGLYDNTATYAYLTIAAEDLEQAWSNIVSCVSDGQ